MNCGLRGLTDAAKIRFSTQRPTYCDYARLSVPAKPRSHHPKKYRKKPRMSANCQSLKTSPPEPKETLREQPGAALVELRRSVGRGQSRLRQDHQRVDDGGAERVQRRLLCHQHAGTDGFRVHLVAKAEKEPRFRGD